MKKITVGVDQGTYTPTNGARTITLAGLSFTPIIEQLAYVYNKTQDELYYAPAEKLAKCTISGSVITIDSTFSTLATGDEIHIQLFVDDDETGPRTVFVENPPQASWTSVETLVSISAQAAATLRYVIPMEGYKDLSMHWKFSNSNAGDTITMTLWGTNNSDADDSADTDWVDISGDYLTKTLTVTNGTIEFAEVLQEIFFLKLMVKLVVVSAADTNAADIYIKKKSL